MQSENLQEVGVEFLKSGTTLSGIIYDENGNFLWPARKPITDYFLATLKIKGIKKVYYSLQKWKTIQQDNPIFSSKTLEYAQEVFDEMVHHIKFGKIPDVKLAREAIEKAFTELDDNEHGFLNLMVLKDFDTYTYIHSINVGLLSMFITKKMGFNDYFIREVGLGGFLHDIGKIKIPNKIVNKRSRLTAEEFRIMKTHPIHGFKLVKDDSTLSNYVKKIILFHHERWDGSGYPMGLKDTSIGNFAQIVSVCDVFDALTTERAYKKAFSINDSLLYIMRFSNKYFSPYISQRFINEITKNQGLPSFYPVGAFVLLNTGEIGYITKKDDEYSLKPEILLIKNTKGLPLRTPIQIDLKKDTSRVIYKTIDSPDEIRKLSQLI